MKRAGERVLVVVMALSDSRHTWSVAEPSLIKRTDFVFLPITSFEKADEFYGGVLGLACSKRYDGGIGGEFETGSLTIQVVDVARIGRKFEPSTGAIALHVDDVEAARSELESRGVIFHGETMDSGVCFQAFFEDQDGNALILHHRYAPPEARPKPPPGS
jgi:catechol 2,3-dioxygenase-like lactoylglutathione lyase family enzyme